MTAAEIIRRTMNEVPAGTKCDQIAETIVEQLSKSGLEIVERASLNAMREAIESRASMAAIGIMLEGAKKGDFVTNWPPHLSPPPGWRKETHHDHTNETVHSMIVKEG